MKAQRKKNQVAGRDITEKPADAVGVVRYRVRTPLQKLHGSRRLTGRQFSAGQALREDDLLSMMVRQPADPDSRRGLLGNGGGACFETAAIDAANRIARVRRACDAVSPLLWPVVQAVVIQEQTITELAGSERGRDTRPYMLALKVGLDVVGDCYGLPTEFTSATVRLNGATAQMEVMEEPNGSWRTRSLNDRPWMFEARTVNEVFIAARAELRARVAAILGPGEHPDAHVGAALKADRIAAQGRAVARHQVNAERELNRLHDVVVERQRVLKVCA